MRNRFLSVSEAGGAVKASEVADLRRGVADLRVGRFPGAVSVCILAGMRDAILPLLLLLGRPASGKSEIIDSLLQAQPAERERLRVGTPHVLDDFPMLWAWFEEDDILQQMGRPRLHSTPDGYFSGQHLWNVLIRRLCLEYDKLAAADNGPGGTTIIEFSRGSEHGGYREAFSHLSESVLAHAAILYVRVSFEESLRKNRRRFNPARPHSILEHGLSDEKLSALYRHDDWDTLDRASPGHIAIKGHEVPAVVFENEDDVTTPRGPALGARLGEALETLRKLRGG